MTTKFHKRTTTVLIIGAIAGLIAFIILLWCVFVKHGAPPHTAGPPKASLAPPAIGRTHKESKNDNHLLPSHVLDYEDVNTELVRLVKVGPMPVKGQDFIFDLQRSSKIYGNTSTAPKEHHSGHFRHLHTELWDPHPQYIIEAFGIKLHLNLRHNNIQQRHKQVINDATNNNESRNHGSGNHGLHVTHLYHNRSTRIPTNTRNCFYYGNIIGEMDSKVSVSLCGGMTGYIWSSEGNFYIEPAEIYNSSSQTSLLHRIHRITSENSKNFDATPMETCDTKTDEITDFQEGNQIIFDDIYTEGTSHNINKRSINNIASYQSKNREFFIEILVVADKTMFDYHKTNETLIHYILTLMSHVSLLYKDATIGNPVNLYVRDILILPDRIFVEKKQGNNGVNSAEMLKKFCEFQNSLKGHNLDTFNFNGHIYEGSNLNEHKIHKRESSFKGYNTFFDDPPQKKPQKPFHSDVAILLTRETICRNTATNQCDTLGLAELGTMCSTQNSCAIIKDKGLPTSYTIAHELGHVLNMPHDDDLEKCARFNAHDSGVKFIMGRMIRNDSKPWLWSKCSRKYLTDFLESKRAGCLLDQPLEDVYSLNNLTSLPGQNYSADQQCSLIFGRGLKLCQYMPPCTYLWCEIHATSDGGCQSQHQPWADGTTCGANSWCIRGRCLRRDPQLLQPVAGAWGPWRRPGACSRSCGGGVRQVERHCDSPRPQNGGPYCVGPSVRYESCNTEHCEEDVEEFREQQCSKFNGNNMGVPGLSSDVKWVPKYEGILPEEHCLLYCRVAHTNQHYLLAERVIDGTKCGFNSHDMCVAGTCRRGGCDNRLGSTLKLDACGICGGDNSQCEQIEGDYHAKPQYGYSKVVRIPKGSSNIDIRQHGWERDGNYLALVDSETGRYVMNGNHLLHAYPTVFMYGGMTLSYTGTDVPIERINSSNSVRLKKDLLVELLSVDKLLPPNITYNYMIARGSSAPYSWQLYHDSWGHCSRMCSGVQRAKPLCTALGSGQVVGDDKCEHLPRDTATTRECNVHCRLTWKILKRLPCSIACGSGLRTIVYHCVKLESSHLSLLEHSGALVHQEAEYLDEEDVPWVTSVDEKHCSDLKRPPEVETCQGTCEEVRWTYGEWSECSRSCGGGTQQRSAVCTSPGRCAAGGPPVSSQPCNTQRCPAWAVAEWTQCNVSCGRGWRMRPYYCQVEGRVHRAEACDGGKVEAPPPSGPSASDDHLSKSKRECSRSCGGGTQQRSAVCTSPGRCAAGGPPVSSQPCNTQRCPAWAVAEWTQCNVSCGRGWRMRPYYCQVEGRVHRAEACDGSKVPRWREECTAPGRPQCARWDAGPWLPCTDCASLQHRPVHCRSFSGDLAPSSECTDLLRPNTTRECPPGACDNSVLHAAPSEWRSGPWSECSRSCGGGAKSRNVACQDSTSGALVEPERCDPGLRPISRVICGAQKCPKWNTGDWSECTGDCRRYRLVICQEFSGTILSPDRCPATERPNNATDCQTHPNCQTDTLVPTSTQENHYNTRYKWKLGSWSACSRSCGRGFRQRGVQCIDQTQNATLVDQFCQHKKPKALKPCHKSECTHIWVEGDWTACTKSCGDGMRFRNVTCHRVLPHGRSAPLGASQNTCDPKYRPVNFEKCSVQPCGQPNSNNQFTWLVGPWKACSQACGSKGRQIRHITCQHNGKKVPKKYCPRNTKPRRKQKCNLKKCSFKNCLEVKQGLNTAHDGEYPIMLGPNNIPTKIYCHKMATNTPQEFLSLKDDGRENYAEIYEKQLLNPDVCPKQGQRHHDCPCRSDDSGTAGLTVFYKLKLNITSLKITSNDFTFSRQMSGVRIPFGTAGDCYSRGECPQGRFAINLQGTGFKLSPKVEWKVSGIHPSFSVVKNAASVSGKCGGYCGGCAPDDQVGLLLEPLASS